MVLLVWDNACERKRMESARNKTKIMPTPVVQISSDLLTGTGDRNIA